MTWFLFFLVSALVLGCIIRLMMLLDVLTYRDLQRRLGEERERGAEE
jgi:hypothetical protein